MNRQMTAERERRAVVTRASGEREAAIAEAEGQKQAGILRSEGERQSQLLRAEGFAQSLQTIFSAAHNIDSNTMMLQYLEALKVIGASPSTKFVVPLELTSLMKDFASGLGKLGGVGDDAPKTGPNARESISSGAPSLTDPKTPPILPPTTNG